MIRTEISLFLLNIPGELGKLAGLLGENQINIDAMTIQDASQYVTELFNARKTSLKRIASAYSYQSVKRDSSEYALVRILVDHTDKAIDLLAKNGYLFDILPVIAIEIENTPGKLAEIAKRIGEQDININYVYGSASSKNETYLFVFAPEDMELASTIYS